MTVNPIEPRSSSFNAFPDYGAKFGMLQIVFFQKMTHYDLLP